MSRCASIDLTGKPVEAKRGLMRKHPLAHGPHFSRIFERDNGFEPATFSLGTSATDEE